MSDLNPQTQGIFQVEAGKLHPKVNCLSIVANAELRSPNRLKPEKKKRKKRKQHPEDGVGTLTLYTLALVGSKE